MERQMSIAFDGIESDTPLNETLRAKYTKSFAYHTVKNRLPITLTKVINDLVTNKGKIIEEHYKKGIEEDLKSVIGQISKLKNELVTNKIFVKLTSKEDDVNEWNEYLDSETKGNSEVPCWYYSAWLFAECYMYRRLWEAFENSQTLQNLDPFSCIKEEAFYQALPAMKALAKDLTVKICKVKGDGIEFQDKFIQYMKLSLWSNRCDLSITNGELGSDDKNLITDVNALNPYLLIDDSLKVYEYLKGSSNIIIDFVTDNTGLEIFSDFCFCDLLCSSSFVSEVKFHIKKLPWFISDVTKNDVKWLMKTLEKEGLGDLTERWKKYFDKGTWTLLDERYWTLPFSYREMKTRDPKLYDSLSGSKLVIFKGDLNSRKLLGDINWNPTETFNTVLGDFKPTSVLALRTVKADLICGLSLDKYKELTWTDKSWMYTGEYAVIQFYKK